MNQKNYSSQNADMEDAFNRSKTLHKFYARKINNQAEKYVSKMSNNANYYSIPNYKHMKKSTKQSNLVNNSRFRASKSDNGKVSEKLALSSPNQSPVRESLDSRIESLLKQSDGKKFPFCLGAASKQIGDISFHNPKSNLMSPPVPWSPDSSVSANSIIFPPLPTSDEPQPPPPEEEENTFLSTPPSPFLNSHQYRKWAAITADVDSGKITSLALYNCKNEHLDNSKGRRQSDINLKTNNRPLKIPCSNILQNKSTSTIVGDKLSVEENKKMSSSSFSDKHGKQKIQSTCPGVGNKVPKNLELKNLPYKVHPVHPSKIVKSRSVPYPPAVFASSKSSYLSTSTIAGSYSSMHPSQPANNSSAVPVPQLATEGVSLLSQANVQPTTQYGSSIAPSSALYHNYSNERTTSVSTDDAFLSASVATLSKNAQNRFLDTTISLTKPESGMEMIVDCPSLQYCVSSVNNSVPIQDDLSSQSSIALHGIEDNENLLKHPKKPHPEQSTTRDMVLHQSSSKNPVLPDARLTDIETSKSPPSNKDKCFEITNAVLACVVKDLKQVIKDDIRKKMIEETAFGRLEKWYDENKHKEQHTSTPSHGKISPKSSSLNKKTVSKSSKSNGDSVKHVESTHRKTILKSSHEKSAHKSLDLPSKKHSKKTSSHEKDRIKSSSHKKNESLDPSSRGDKGSTHCDSASRKSKSHKKPFSKSSTPSADGHKVTKCFKSANGKSILKSPSHGKHVSKSVKSPMQ